MLRAGSTDFREHCRKTPSTFEMSEQDELPCDFAVFKISAMGFSMDQNQYLRNLESLPAATTFPEFRSMRMKLGRLGNSRADCAIEISQLLQVTDAIFEEHHRDIVKRINRMKKFAVENPVSLKFPKLNLDTIRVIGFSDASFAKNYHLSSQLGHIVFIADGEGNAAPICFKSYKARRVSRSVMAAKVIATRSMWATVSRQSCRIYLGGKSSSSSLRIASLSSILSPREPAHPRKG